MVVHFAAESHVDRSIGTPAPFVTTNVLGTQVLLDAARAAGRSAGSCTSRPTRCTASIERAPGPRRGRSPDSPYAASKAGSDLLALAAHRTHGMDVVVTRCSNNYGPYQFPEKVIPLFVTNLLDGKPLPLYGDGANIRDWLHVSDHCARIAAVRRRAARRGLPHRRRHPELTNRELTGRLLRPAAPAGTGSTRSPTARATTAGTHWTSPRSVRTTGARVTSDVGPAWPRPSPGTATTGPGGSRQGRSEAR